LGALGVQFRHGQWPGAGRRPGRGAVCEVIDRLWPLQSAGSGRSRPVFRPLL